MISKYDTLKKDIFRLNEDEEFYKAYYRAGHSYPKLTKEMPRDVIS